MTTSSSKPPYLLGLVCFIPLIGAFVGVALLLYGLIKYKDKWLSLIGILGILFTVGIYSFLFYYMKNGDLSKKGFSEISQMHLNNLVKNIEFYKIQHGQYPDNLKQLLTDDKLAPVTDAIQLVQQIHSTTTKKRGADIYSILPDRTASPKQQMIYFLRYP